MNSFIRQIVLDNIYLIVFPLLLCAQDNEYQNLTDQGFEFFHDRKYEEAKDILEKAVKKYPEKTEAYIMLGEIGKVKQDWQEAKDWYDAVVKMIPNHKEALYQLGICDREDGVGRDPILRTIMWRNSAKHFRTVITLDSTYKQVFYEYALLRRYQQNYIEAIDLCLRQLRNSPDCRDAQIGIFNFYDLFLTYGGDVLSNVFENKDNIQIEWLEKRSAEYDLFFLGEKYRRMEQFSKADSIYKKLERKRLPFTKIPLYLAQTRLYYQLDKVDEAEKKYHRAINTIKSNTDINFIFEDVKYILTDSDLRSHFNSLEDIKNYYRGLWNKKNPLNSMRTNYRLSEHYKRLVEVEKKFRYDGFRLPIHNPDRTRTLQFPAIFYNNSKFNHKGLVFLRFGAPDDFAKQTDADLANNESWLYRETSQHPKLIFHFEVHDQGPPGDWRLVPVPSNQAMLESRLGWDQRLDQYYMANTQLDIQTIENEIQMESVKNVRRAMSSERHTWDDDLKPLTMSTSTARFLNDEGEPSLEIYIGIAKDELFSNNSEKSSSLIETGVAIQDTTWKTIYKIQHEAKIVSIDTNMFFQNTYIDIFPAEAPINKFYLASHIRDMNEPRLAGNRVILELDPLPKNKLAVSDLLVAYSIEPATKPSKYFKHGMEVIPNPSKRFRRSDLVNFYYEVYNLNVLDGHALYKVDQTVRPAGDNKNIVQKFFGLFGGSKSQTVTISKEHQNKGPMASEFTAFDFGKFDKGSVEMVIKITDLNSGSMAETQTTFELY